MSIKKKLGMGAASAALGIALIGGGTYAYFSDVETSSNTFAAGKLDLSVNPTEVINVSNIKPGDTVTRDFQLINGGTLDISQVILDTQYTVNDAKGDNKGEDFADHIQLEFIINKDKRTEVVKTAKLSALQKADVVDRDLLGWILGGERDGLKAGDTDNLTVKFTFVDNKKDQNKFQEDSIDMEWTFNAKQTSGVSK